MRYDERGLWGLGGLCGAPSGVGGGPVSSGEPCGLECVAGNGRVPRCCAYQAGGRFRWTSAGVCVAAVRTIEFPATFLELLRLFRWMGVAGSTKNPVSNCPETDVSFRGASL